jgi:hypothetical protein
MTVPPAPARLADLTARGFGVARAHRAFAVILTLGAALRLAAFAAYWPALEFYGDSYTYLSSARLDRLDATRPWGYPALLKILSASPTLAVVPAAQHLCGLAAGVGIYVTLLRRAVPPGWSAAAAAPLLLDGYQIDIEQMVMAETLFTVLVAAACGVALWRARPNAPMCAALGLLAAAAALTRVVALFAVVALCGYLALRAVTPARMAAYILACAIPLFGYAAAFQAAHGRFALEGTDGLFLWGRVAPFADCRRISPPPDEVPLCSPHPARERPGPNYYDWDSHSPRTRIAARGNAADALLGDMARRTIMAQPGDYVAVVLQDTLHYLAPGRRVGPRDWYLESWRFPVGTTDPAAHITMPLRDLRGRRVARRYDPALGGLLRAYQVLAYTPGPALAACAGLGLLGALAYPGAGRARARHDCLLLVAVGLGLLIVPSLTADFDYRYGLPTLVCLPPAGALGANQLRVLGRARSGPARDQRAAGRPG